MPCNRPTLRRNLCFLFVFLLTACNLPFSSGTGSGARDPGKMQLGIAETVVALGDPEHAEDGVWSLLANLGIGVYTGDGTPDDARFRDGRG